MTEKAGGVGRALDAAVIASAEQGAPQRRPDFIPAHYVWDENLGPLEDSTGRPRGAWREPTDEEGAAR